jgi:hypothetical protein
MCACVRLVFAVVESRGAERQLSALGETVESGLLERHLSSLERQRQLSSLERKLLTESSLERQLLTESSLERHLSSPGETLEVCNCRLINQCASVA